MNLPWFRRVGIFFIPVSLTGWLILSAGICYAVYSFMDIDGRSHSVSDTLSNFAIKFFLIGVFYTLIAFLTSRPSRK